MRPKFRIVFHIGKDAVKRHNPFLTKRLLCVGRRIYQIAVTAFFYVLSIGYPLRCFANKNIVVKQPVKNSFALSSSRSIILFLTCISFLLRQKFKQRQFFYKLFKRFLAFFIYSFFPIFNAIQNAKYSH